MKLCLGCMRNLEEGVTTCPHCGFDETKWKQESYYLIPGTIVGGKYVVGRALEYSGYTIQYMGLDAEKNRKVIVKEYLPSDFSTRSAGDALVTIYSGDALEQFNQGLVSFLNEGSRIQSLGAVDGIANVYDCVSENDTGYVISEYIEGRSLQEILSDGVRYQAKEAQYIICEILRGLSKLHAQNIIHCDIAPQNIMMTGDGKVKLVNFGATRYVTTSNSKSLAVMLKQGYAPEEQYRSMGKRGPWTDVYAIGAVMYRMITGKVPQEAVERTLEDKLETPSKLGATMYSGMENALMNALNVYQNERTKDAGCFYSELQNPNTVRIKVKKKKRDTGKIPLWLKALVAMVACAVIVGGVAVVKQKSGKRDAKPKDGFVLLTGARPESLKDWGDRWSHYGYTTEDIDVEFRYDSNPQNDFMVQSFEVYEEAEEKIGNGKDVVKSSELQTEEKNQDGKVAKIIVSSYQGTSLLSDWKKGKVVSTYESDKNYQPKGEGINFYSEPQLPDICTTNGNDKNTWGTIQEIKIDESEIEDQNKTLLKWVLKDNFHYFKDIHVKIHTGDYHICTHDDFMELCNSLKVKKEDDFANKHIDVKKIKMKYGSEKKGFKVSRLKPGYYKADYISLTEKKGTICEVDTVVKQLLTNESYSYDAHKNGVKKLFHTVSEKIVYKNEASPAEVKKDLEKKLKDIKAKNASVDIDTTVGADEVDKITISCNGEIVSHFKKDDKVTITIKAKESRPTPAPTSVQKKSATKKTPSDKKGKKPGNTTNDKWLTQP